MIAWLASGMTITRVVYPLATARSLGAFVEAGVGWRFERRLAASAFAGYASFDDHAYLGSLDVVHHFYELGGRLAVNLYGIDLGAEIGVELDDATAFFDVPAHRDTLPLVGIDARVPVVRLGRLQVMFAASVQAARNPNTSSDLSLYGDVFAARLGIGLQL